MDRSEDVPECCRSLQQRQAQCCPRQWVLSPLPEPPARSPSPTPFGRAPSPTPAPAANRTYVVPPPGRVQVDGRTFSVPAPAYMTSTTSDRMGQTYSRPAPLTGHYDASSVMGSLDTSVSPMGTHDGKNVTYNAPPSPMGATYDAWKPMTPMEGTHDVWRPMSPMGTTPQSDMGGTYDVPKQQTYDGSKATPVAASTPGSAQTSTPEAPLSAADTTSGGAPSHHDGSPNLSNVSTEHSMNISQVGSPISASTPDSTPTGQRGERGQRRVNMAPRRLFVDDSTSPSSAPQNAFQQPDAPAPATYSMFPPSYAGATWGDSHPANRPVQPHPGLSPHADVVFIEEEVTEEIPADGDEKPVIKHTRRKITRSKGANMAASFSPNMAPHAPPNMAATWGGAAAPRARGDVIAPDARDWLGSPPPPPPPGRTVDPNAIWNNGRYEWFKGARPPQWLLALRGWDDAAYRKCMDTFARSGYWPTDEELGPGPDAQPCQLEVGTRYVKKQDARLPLWLFEAMQRGEMDLITDASNHFFRYGRWPRVS